MLLFLAGTTPAWAEPAPVRLQLKWQHQFQFAGFLYNTEPAPAKPTWLFISVGALAVLLALAGALAYSHKRNRTKSGNHLTCEWHNTLYHAADGPVAGAISIGADVSERILAQERLKQAKDIAEQLLADQRQFLAMLSHEIRSPLATVSSAAQLLQSRCASACGDSAIIERIQRGVRRLAASGFRQQLPVGRAAGPNRRKRLAPADRQPSRPRHLHYRALARRHTAPGGTK